METDITKKTCILSSAYLGPVSYFKKIADSEKIIIEQYDHYIKQTYRNRCRIAASNQIMNLTIPVHKTGEKCAMKDIRISYFEDWQKIHWRAIESAYNSTPFFDYYKDDLLPIYQKKNNYLLDLNNELQSVILELLSITTPICLSDQYHKAIPEETEDCRNLFLSKQETLSQLKPYYQVFDHKYGFLKDLSIIDLLFNMGPESVFYL
jgi:hypothetical protein